ncbi:MAG: Uma2 family endonuclease [Verrucomicrobia bacterium]|nr:Uma2 family endonuclease [Leptolyngbya sp. ES-bin-22]
MVLSNQPDTLLLGLDALDPDVVFPPDDLESDEPPLESTRHLKQLILLLTCLEWLWSDRADFFVGGNLTVYYNIEQLTTRDFRGPDLFVALHTERRERKSWMVWAEGGQYPNFILELLSDSTASVDRGVKKQLYQDIFRTPEYLWFHPDTLEFQGFRLISSRYEAIVPNEQGWLWSEALQLYLGIFESRLRFFTATGALVPTPEEAALQAQAQAETERQRAEAEQQRAEQAEAQTATERQRVDQLLAQLRAAGIDPDSLS